jgi:mRNA-degrading endonuclease RelE of RelBE toxin-antitoxin system
MSLKAKGLLSEMLSLPDDWDYSIAGLAAINKESISSIKTALSEPQTFGYLKIEKIYPDKSSSGRIEYVYNVFELPQNQPLEDQNIEKQEVEKQEVENQPLENQREYNIKKQNINNKKINNKVYNNAEEFKLLFNTICISLPQVRLLTKKRERHIKTLLSTLEELGLTPIDYLKKVENSDFLSGRSGKWRATFDWIIIPSNAVKIIEGNYSGGKEKESKSSYDIEELNKINTLDFIEGEKENE